VSQGAVTIKTIGKKRGREERKGKREEGKGGILKNIEYRSKMNEFIDKYALYVHK
jgi:hypothetical protein